MNVNCSKCGILIIMENKKKIFDDKKHIVLCDVCCSNNNFYSLSYCKKKLLLNSFEIENIKYLFNEKSNKKLYLVSEINDLIINKHNENLDEKNIKKISRKTSIKKMFDKLNLKYTETGDIYSYINYGYPPLDDIINYHMNKNIIIKERKNTLDDKLKEKNIIYNDKMVSCYQYINKINQRSLEDTLKMAELESWLMNNTEYLQFLQNNNQQDSIIKAIHKYQNIDLNNIINKNINK